MVMKVRSLREVPAAVKSAIARSGIEQLMVAQAKRRIENGGDSELRWPPLKDLSGPARAFFDEENRRRVVAGHRPIRRPAEFGSFRAGGQPLLDTRQHIYNVLSGMVRRDASSVRFQVRSGGPTPLVAVYHQAGYKTKGPNFIPLTLKARRTHVKGANPRAEGLVPGIDYYIAWRGVKVPARPIVRFAPEDTMEVRAALRGSFA